MKTSKDVRQKIARWSESIAARKLARQGLIIWKRNVRCHKGEIDILALSPRTLHIIEVKARRFDSHEFTIDRSISDLKLKRMAKATSWLMRKEAFKLKRMAILHVSFDFVGIEYDRTRFSMLRAKTFQYEKGMLGQAMLRNNLHEM